MISGDIPIIAHYEVRSGILRSQHLFFRTQPKDVKISSMSTVGARIRRMLAAELKVEEQALTDDFRWLDAMGSEDAEYFLARINNAFTRFPPGLSFGDGKRPFGHIGAETLEQIATVSGLVIHIERHVTGAQP